jgi:hypothetical protein
MVSEQLDFFGQAIRVRLFDCIDGGAVKSALTLLKQTPIGNFVSQRVLESIFEIGEKISLIEKFRRLKASESPPEFFFR